MSARRPPSLAARVRARAALAGRALRGADSWRLGGPPLSDEQAATLAPVFVLSTGRCGTAWLTTLLEGSRLVVANHDLPPELVRQSRLAWEAYAEASVATSAADGAQTPAVDPAVEVAKIATNPATAADSAAGMATGSVAGLAKVAELVELVRAARDDLLSGAQRAGRGYVETNNRITFLAPAVARAYPRSRFVHLLRHPGPFVRSGLRRGWYARADAHAVGRIRMTDDTRWSALEDRERIAWLWNETNAFVECFAATMPADRFLRVTSEAMFADPQIAAELCRFVGAEDLGPDDAARLAGRRINRQEGGDVPPFAAWPAAEVAAVHAQCPLAAGYGYRLDAADGAGDGDGVGGGDGERAGNGAGDLDGDGNRDGGVDGIGDSDGIGDLDGIRDGGVRSSVDEPER